MATERTTKLPIRRFNVDEYYKMAEIGILPWGGGYELIDGIVCLKGHGTPRRFTVDDYYAMAEAGILSHDERVELVNGEIVEMSPIGKRHRSSVYALGHLISLQLGDQAIVGVQNAVHLDNCREFQPDVTILKSSDDFYLSYPPGPDDVLLLIEVSDSSLSYDRNVKLSLYAGAGIPEFWIVNIPDGVVEVFTDPSEGEYQTRRAFGAEDSVSPSAFSDISLPVSRIVPA
jgi:Uma2 family endonuclease